MKKLLLFLLVASLPALAASAKITTNATTCATAGACLVVSVPQDTGGAALTISGTWTGTISFEATADGGTTWVAIDVMPVADTTLVSSTTANGVWQVNMTGLTGIRMRSSASMTGSALATINRSNASFAR